MVGFKSSEVSNLEDKFKKMEKTLYDYRRLNTAITNLDIEIERIKNDITLQGISYEDKGSPTNAFSSSVENEVIRREKYVADEINRLQRLKADKVALNAKIYNALKDLDPLEHKLVELRYLERNKEKRSWISIGIELNFTAKYCQEIRNKIINNLAEIVFP
jgi:DNA-directed RNA polymerase sigma subunit (sigma70/sigma32)